MRINVLDHGYVALRNISGPIRRRDAEYDADDTDPANSARFSFDGADKNRAREDDLRLAEYLLKNKHTTPFEMIEIWLEMKLPIFTARQFVRHRTTSINEISGRYVQLPGEFYIPDPATVGIKSATNKQGRTIVEEAEDLTVATWFCDTLREHCLRSYERYARAIQADVPNELARCFLPVNIYTKWLWKQDLHNIMHFLKLRIHNHAQYEARQYGEAIVLMLRTVLPETMNLFDKYCRLEEE